MTAPDQFVFELVVRSGHPALLEGLEAWLRLGLLSDQAVRQLCQEQLSCPLPEVIRIADVEPTAVEPTAVSPLARPIGLIARLAQSFAAEISVVWLLFLGVFMVVVSSGVLAATQWKNFPPVGQYMILLAYTIAFWVASVWTGRQPALRLTARMLQISTLLIIPVNFWTMDGFRLWRSGSGLAVAAIAALILTTITIRLLKPATAEPDHTRLILATAIALSYLHWGWSWAGYPLVATYLGTIGAAVSLTYQDQSREREAEAEEIPTSHSPLPTPDSLPPAPSLAFITIALSSLLLLARALLVAQVPLNQLGLAAGISGGLLCWLARRDAARILWTRAGVGLLVLGWLVTVSDTPPGQAIAISALGLWLLADYLRRLGQIEYLNVGFLVGLQTVWLLWRTVPPAWQQRIITTCTQLAGPLFMPEALIGLWFFPYLALTVWLAGRFRQWQRPDLAKQAEFLALGLGLVLTSFSVGNPLVRSLNLTLSAVTLAIVTQRRTHPQAPLIYLTHGTGLAAIVACIDQFAPTLSLNIWVAILILGMVMEWTLSVFLSRSSHTAPSQTFWQRSTWHFGLILALLSYLLLRRTMILELPTWSGLWLVTPIALTVLGDRSNERSVTQRQSASWLSVVALLLAQPLLFNSGAGRLTSFGVAAGLMLVNTRQVQHWLTAVLTVGFGLSFAAAAVWEIFSDRLTVGWSANLLAIAVLVLWLLRGWLQRRSTVLAALYRQATAGWAMFLTGVTLVLLTLCNLVVYLELDSPNWQYTSAAALLLIATSYRIWQQPRNAGFYTIAWSLELLLTSTIALTGRSLDTLAIVNLALGLATQLLGDWWIQHRIQDSPPRTASSWHVVPLLYAALGVLLQHRSFTASTGLFTLAAAIVGIGVGRRKPFKTLLYLSILSASFAAYELLVYDLFQVTGSAGDGFVLLAGLAALIAIADRLLLRWLMSYVRLTASEVLGIAHVHWALGSALLPLVIANSLSSSGQWRWIAIAAILSAYALAMGNRLLTPASLQPLIPTSITWTYLGIIESLLTLAYLLHILLSDAWLSEWAGTIVAAIAAVLYLAPWQAWGWEQKPWRNSAIVLPLTVTLATAGSVALQGLLIVAAFYAWLAKAERQPRLSYLSVGLANWAAFRLLDTYDIREPLWVAALLAASLLYIAQVDPALRSTSERQNRHLLRSLAAGLVCATAIYQAEVGISGILPVLVGLLSIGLALGFTLAGLLLRVRAFLYIGTIAFIVQALRQLQRFTNDYSLPLWIVGILLGLAFIWVAATFEARRAQISTFVQYWMTELEQWD